MKCSDRRSVSMSFFMGVFNWVNGVKYYCSVVVSCFGVVVVK